MDRKQYGLGLVKVRSLWVPTIDIDLAYKIHDDVCRAADWFHVVEAWETVGRNVEPFRPGK